MGIFDKFFGPKNESPKPSYPVVPPAPSEPVDPSKSADFIRVYDNYGRELFISRKEWRENVLRGNIDKAWENPDELYGMLLSALNDGFRSDILHAARQLHKIDSVPARGACLWGIVLMEEGRLDEAEQVFLDHTARHGEDGSVLVNLAKVYAKRDDQVKSGEILWRALEADPNQSNGMSWYESIHRERDGDEAGKNALIRVAALPRSWRAQLWLARLALQSRRLEEALTYYQNSLSHAGQPYPVDMLQQISGDLGNAGHLPEMIDLVTPHFDPAIHGILVGNNLIKSHLDLGQIDAARMILNQLYALKRPDWREPLSFWDTEIAKTRIDTDPVDAAALEVTMLTIEGPVWLRPDSAAAELFTAKTGEAPRITIVGSSAETATNSKATQRQLSDSIGRLSRALPLFLAEKLELCTTTRVRTLLPWLVSGNGGFVLSGVRWTNEEAASYSRQGENPSDYVIICHIKAQSEPWQIELSLVRSIDGKCIAELETAVDVGQLQASLPGLAGRVIATVVSETSADRLDESDYYLLPEQPHFPSYLLRLEQLLAVRCSAMEGVTQDFLSGERDIVDGNIQLCLGCPKSVSVRILLAQTLVNMKRARADIMSEYREKVFHLFKENPLPEPAQSVLQRIIKEVFGA